MKKFQCFQITLVSLVLILDSSCASHGTLPSEDASLSLDNSELIKLGVTHANEVKALFGSPRQILPPLDAVSNGEAWIYCERAKCGSERLTVQFDTKSDVVNSIAWSPKDGEAEQKLETLLSRYRDVGFKHSRYLYNYGHYIEYVDSYTDSSGSLILDYDSVRKTVTSVHRIIPGLQSKTVSSSSGLPIITLIPDAGTASNP